MNVTPFEPEWEGYVTLEFSNTTPLPAKIYANEGCAQVLFFEGDEECETSYRTEAESTGAGWCYPPQDIKLKNRVVFLDFMLEIADNTPLPGLARGRMPS